MSNEPITKRDALESSYFHAGPCITLITLRGAQTTITETWRANGQLKTWKRDPARFQLPIKYGLRECWYLTPDNAASFHCADHCVPTVFNVRSMRPALDILQSVRRAAYRVGNVPTIDQYRASLERADLIVTDNANANI